MGVDDGMLLERNPVLHAQTLQNPYPHRPAETYWAPASLRSVVPRFGNNGDYSRHRCA